MNLSKETWTPDLVESWLQIAALVDKALPPIYRKGYAGPKWNIVRAYTELMWDVDKPDEAKYRFQPTNHQVSMWEEIVLRWFPLIEDSKDKQILWHRACGMSWTTMAKKVGMTRQSISVRHRKALEDLAKKLQLFYAKIS